jgi:hypothetical protein
MGVHAPGELERAEVPLLRERQFGEEFGDVRADEVSAEKLSVAGVGDELDETGGFAQTLGFPVRLEGEAGDDDLVARGAGLLLGDAEGGDLRLAERLARASSGNRRGSWSRPPLAVFPVRVGLGFVE